jgi:hypothetical protein
MAPLGSQPRYAELQRASFRDWRLREGHGRWVGVAPTISGEVRKMVPDDVTLADVVDASRVYEPHFPWADAAADDALVIDPQGAMLTGPVRYSCEQQEHLPVWTTSKRVLTAIALELSP